MKITAKDKSNKGWIFFLILIMISFGICYFYLPKHITNAEVIDYKQSEQPINLRGLNIIYRDFYNDDLIQLEYGSGIHNVYDDLKQFTGNLSIIGQQYIDTNYVGQRKITFRLTDKNESKDFLKTYEIVDTKYPSIQIIDDTISITQGDNIDFNNNVLIKDEIDGLLPFANELNNGSYIFESNFNNQIVGDYNIKVIALDRNGNRSEDTFSILVNERKIETASTTTNNNQSNTQPIKEVQQPQNNNQTNTQPIKEVQQPQNNNQTIEQPKENEQTNPIVEETPIIEEKEELVQPEPEVINEEPTSTPVEENEVIEENNVVEEPIEPSNNSSYSGPKLTASAGVVEGPSGKETYYNLPMDVVVNIMRQLGYDETNYPYWVREDGCKMLGNYIMIAANYNIRPRGTLVETSLGTGIVCDTGSFVTSNPTQIDIAVNW